jgi:hypothetical protein
MSQQAILREVGESLYGARWQSEVARALKVSDRTVRRWVAGTDEPPSGVLVDLLRLADERITRIESSARRLHDTIASKPDRAPEAPSAADLLAIGVADPRALRQFRELIDRD